LVVLAGAVSVGRARGGFPARPLDFAAHARSILDVRKVLHTPDRADPVFPFRRAVGRNEIGGFLDHQPRWAGFTRGMSMGSQPRGFSIWAKKKPWPIGRRKTTDPAGQPDAASDPKAHLLQAGPEFEGRKEARRKTLLRGGKESISKNRRSAALVLEGIAIFSFASAASRLALRRVFVP